MRLSFETFIQLFWKEWSMQPYHIHVNLIRSASVSEWVLKVSSGNIHPNWKLIYSWTCIWLLDMLLGFFWTKGHSHVLNLGHSITQPNPFTSVLGCTSIAWEVEMEDEIDWVSTWYVISSDCYALAMAFWCLIWLYVCF